MSDVAKSDGPLFPRIVRTPGVVGGNPRIDGTRWPTEIAVAFNFDPLAISDAYPHLRIDQIMAAIVYEQSWRRRLGRRIESARFHVAAWLLGIDVDVLRDTI